MPCFILKKVLRMSSGDESWYEFFRNENDVILRRNEIIRSFKSNAEKILDDYDDNCIEEFFSERGAYQFIESMEGLISEDQLIENIIFKFFCWPDIFYLEN